MSKSNEVEKSSWLRDRLYDTVFHVGDTAQNFLWDAVYGPSPKRSKKYHKRQIGRNNRNVEVPLTKEERMVFTKILERSNGEKLLDYWKRQRALLNYTDKQSLVHEYCKKERALEAAQKTENSLQRQKKIQQLEEQFRKIKHLSASSKQRTSKKPL